MKLKRVKAYKKLMGYLQLNFQFREPYQVLVDEEIILAAITSKYDLVAGLERTLQGKVKVLVTQCTVEHLYRAKTAEAKEAVKLAKTFERRRCGHIAKPEPGEEKEVKPTPLSAFECIVECVGPKNKHRYCIASQKPKLRAKFRHIPAIPLIYINRSVMIMEPMSPATLAVRNEIEQAKLVRGLNQAGVTPAENSVSIKKSHKVKEPNPLSVKKRQRMEPDADGIKKRRRGKRGGASKEKNESAEHDPPAEVA